MSPQVAYFPQLRGVSLLRTTKRPGEGAAPLGDGAELHLGVRLRQGPYLSIVLARIGFRHAGRPVLGAEGLRHHGVNKVKESLREQRKGSIDAIAVGECHVSLLC